MSKWKWIPGYKNLYMINKKGKIKIMYGNRPYVETYIDKYGYRRCTLTRCKKQKGYGLHRLLYVTFKGKIPKEHVVRHLDDNKANNKLSNLRIGTIQDNADDAKRNNKTLGGERNPNASLTKSKIMKIIKMHHKGIPLLDIAQKMNCSDSCIRGVLNKKTYIKITNELNIKRLSHGKILSDKHENKIRKLLKKGILGKTIAIEFGVSSATISNIKNNKRLRG